jgi:hypothetical protein
MMMGLVQYEILQSEGYSALHTFSIDFNYSFSNSDKMNLDRILDEGSTLRTALIISTFEDKPMLVGWSGKNDNRWFVLDEGRFFTKEEILNSEQYVIISAGLYNKPDFDYKEAQFEIGNEPFNIIGIGMLSSNSILFIMEDDLYSRYYPFDEIQDMHQYHDVNQSDEEISPGEGISYVPASSQTEIIPYTTYFKLGYSPNIVRLEYMFESSENFKKINEMLSITFPQAMIYTPSPPVQYYTPDMISNIMQSVLLTLCALINIAALFVYWLSANKSVHTVYAICGANRRKIVLLITFEWLIITVLSYITSLLIQYIASPLTNILYISFKFSFLQYSLILIIGYLLTMIFLIPQITRNSQLIRG